MYDPATRLLTVIHLLHIHRTLSAEALAAKMEVSTRTIRRYITMLRDVGVAIEVEMGRDGGYQLARRNNVPPSLFSKEELELLLVALSCLAAKENADQKPQALDRKIRQLLEISE